MTGLGVVDFASVYILAWVKRIHNVGCSLKFIPQLKEPNVY